MNDQLFEELYSQITDIYLNAHMVYGHNNTTDNVFRKRQHTMSSRIEDLFAITIYRYLKREYPDSSFCCMVDYSIRILGKTLFPDIAIIREDTAKPVLVSYIDIKTDLGYKREYHENFQNIENIIKEARKVGTINRLNSKNNSIIVNPNLNWKTAVVSDQNINKLQLNKCRESAIKSCEYLNLYFLSTGLHPNSKDPKKIIQNKDFNLFLYDLKKEFEEMEAFKYE